MGRYDYEQNKVDPYKILILDMMTVSGGFDILPVGTYVDPAGGFEGAVKCNAEDWILT